jgi:hypothetical protein
VIGLHTPSPPVLLRCRSGVSWFCSHVRAVSVSGHSQAVRLAKFPSLETPPFKWHPNYITYQSSTEAVGSGSHKGEPLHKTDGCHPLDSPQQYEKESMPIWCTPYALCALDIPALNQGDGNHAGVDIPALNQGDGKHAGETEAMGHSSDLRCFL